MEWKKLFLPHISKSWTESIRKLDFWVWMIVVLLFFSAGLHGYAYYLQEHGQVAGMLLFLYVGSWLNVISIVAMTVISGIIILHRKPSQGGDTVSFP